MTMELFRNTNRKHLRQQNQNWRTPLSAQLKIHINYEFKMGINYSTGEPKFNLILGATLIPVYKNISKQDLRV